MKLQKRKRSVCPVCSKRTIVRRDIDPKTRKTWRITEECKECRYSFHSEYGIREECIGLITMLRDWHFDDRNLDREIEMLDFRQQCIDEARQLWSIREVRQLSRAAEFANANRDAIWKRLYNILERGAEFFPINWKAAQMRGVDNWKE